MHFKIPQANIDIVAKNILSSNEPIEKILEEFNQITNPDGTEKDEHRSTPVAIPQTDESSTVSYSSSNSLILPHISSMSDQLEIKFMPKLDTVKYFDSNQPEPCENYLIQLTDICARIPDILDDCKTHMLLLKQNDNIASTTPVSSCIPSTTNSPIGVVTTSIPKDEYSPISLDDNELLAISVLTYDIRSEKNRRDNFYYKFNEILRERTPAIMKRLEGYLYYMQKALGKIPPVSKTVYRGIPGTTQYKGKQENTVKLISENYKHLVKWTSYSSTTTDFDEARKFASDDGVIIEINVNHGKDISRFSVFPNEGEILLSPNMLFEVVSPLHQRDGINVIVLKEKVDGYFVF